MHTAVIARQNYSGQLASILQRLPTERTLTGAKIFTSRNHGFIIDLFEFEPLDGDNPSTDLASDMPVEESIEKVSEMTQADAKVIRKFISSYSPTSQILDYPDSLAEHFCAANEVRESNSPSIRTFKDKKTGSGCIGITVASQNIGTRQLVQLVAGYLGQHEFDIEQAHLHDLTFEKQQNIAIASIELTHPDLECFQAHKAAIKDLLNSQVGG